MPMIYSLRPQFAMHPTLKVSFEEIDRHTDHLLFYIPMQTVTQTICNSAFSKWTRQGDWMTRNLRGDRWWTRNSLVFLLLQDPFSRGFHLIYPGMGESYREWGTFFTWQMYMQTSSPTDVTTYPRDPVSRPHTKQEKHGGIFGGDLKYRQHLRDIMVPV